MVSSEIADLANGIRAGSVRALARGLTWIEGGGDRAIALADDLYRDGGRAHIVGITGAPGAGKSTLVRALARAARAESLTVGIIAVDPSSPFSGGSILGDRIRMNDLTLDPGIFIRSMATRGALGGLCRTAGEAVDLVSASGRDLVLLETVGVGQDEVDVMGLAHTTVVVSVPGLGDEIQTLKAGIMEIADVHVVNKADRDGADRTISALRSMLMMGLPQRAAWESPIISCVATQEQGAGVLLEAILRHRNYLNTTDARHSRERRIAESRVLKVAQGLVAETLRRSSAHDTQMLKADLERVVRREQSPYRCARAVLARMSEAERVSSHV
jgi:LAO/AO transport system kinase